MERKPGVFGDHAVSVRDSELLHNSGQLSNPQALYLTATEFALTQTCPDLPSDSAPHI